MKNMTTVQTERNLARKSTENMQETKRANALKSLIEREQAAELRREARKLQRELAKKSIAARKEVQAKDRLDIKINKAETAFSALCKIELLEFDKEQSRRLMVAGQWINPETEVSDEMFMQVAAAQAAATKWFGGMAESVRALMSRNEKSELLPLLFDEKGEKRHDTEVVRIMFAVIRSAFIHRSMTYSLASHSVNNLRGYELQYKEQVAVVEWLRMFRLFEIENDVNRTHVANITDEKGNVKQEVVKSQPTAVLSQKAMQLLCSCLYENQRRLPQTKEFAPIAEEFAFSDNEGAKPGSNPLLHTQHAEIHSVAGARARAAADKLAAVPLGVSQHFFGVLSKIWMPGQERKLEKSALKEKREVSDKEHRLLTKQLLRLQKLYMMFGDNAIYIAKFFDYRGRIYDGSGELSMQGLKDLRGFFRFHNYADANRSVDMNQIHIQLGRMKLECYGDKRKITDEEARKIGAAWNGCTEKGGIYAPAAMLLEDPARAICALDANQQGYQLSALAFGDTGLALLTNVTANADGVLRDLYGAVAQLVGNKNRSHAKAWMLPYLYGAGAEACARDFNAEVPAEERVTKLQMRKWIESFEAAFFGASALRKHISRMVGRHFDISDRSDTNMAAMARASACTFRWTLPDGFIVEYAINEVENLTINKADEVADFKVKFHNTWRKSLPAMVIALAPNIVHSVDAYMLRRVVELCDFEIVAIHDSYGCHSVNVARMNEVIVQVMQEIAEMDLINNILAQIELIPAAETNSIFANLNGATIFGRTGYSPLPKDLVNCKYMFI